MAKPKGVEWFGAEYETSNGGRTTTVVNERLLGPNGRPIRVRTTGRDDQIAKVTARYKYARSVFESAPPDDKAQREREMNIAYAEMQLERFAQQLEKYRARPDARPDQIKVYQDRIDSVRGQWLRLTGQE